MSQILDDFDRKILRELQKDSSRPVTQIAVAVGLSQAPCWRRLQRLRSEGFIEREVAVLDRDKLGWEIEMFIFVRLNAHGRATITEFTESVLGHEQVIGAYIVLGNVDLMLHVVARNIRDYERFFLEHLSQASGVHEVNTMTVMSQLKSEIQIPV
jgi:Lrp/AsnC family transcriptional regulator